MISREEVNIIIESDNANIQDMLSVIRFYIYDRQKEEILDINIPNNNPCIVGAQMTTQIQLCYHMYNICVKYYKELNQEIKN